MNPTGWTLRSTKMTTLQIASSDLLKVQLTAGPFAGQFAGPRFRFVP